MNSFKISTSGQNVLIFEAYPRDVSSKMSHFSSKWAYCGLGHPVTAEHRNAVIIANVADKSAYIASSLHRVIHAGLSPSLVNDYILTLQNQGYTIVKKEHFVVENKHILIVGSDESIIIPNFFAMFNIGTPQFEIVEPLFHTCNLSLIGKSLLCEKNTSLLQASTNATSRGQPAMINLGYAMQNSTDGNSIPGLNIPRLTYKSLIDLINVESSEPLLHHIIEMMTCATNFLLSNHQKLNRKKPFQNKKRNRTFGNKIAKSVGHPNEALHDGNCFELCTTGFKTTEVNGFGSHVDVLNSRWDPSYEDVLVLSEVDVVPANCQVKFGNDEVYYPFAIFCNRLGCETTMTFDQNIEQWLSDLVSYIDQLPENIRVLDKNSLSISRDNKSVIQIIERDDELICHQRAHLNKHVQLSSYCYTIHKAIEDLPWWTEVHTIEYLYFVGLCCTPVTPWFAMKNIFENYKNNPPNKCLVELLIDFAVTTQGGIDRASGHRYTSSSGMEYNTDHLIPSLRNLRYYLQLSNDNNDSSMIINKISRGVKEGGCYKIGNLSATEILTTYHLCGVGRNLIHTVNAVINEKNTTTRVLESDYGFNRNQRSKLLDIAKQRLPQLPKNEIENGNCKMCIEKRRSLNRHDTTFASQELIFTSDGKERRCMDKEGIWQCIQPITFKRSISDINERRGVLWYENESVKEAAESCSCILRLAMKDKTIRAKTKILFDRNKTKNDTEEAVNSSLKNQRCRKRKGTVNINDIYVTKFAPKSMEYIKRRSGIMTKESKRRKMTRVKKSKKACIDDKEEKMFQAKMKQVKMDQIHFPKLYDLLESWATKTIDFTNLVAYVLQTKVKKYKASLSFTSTSIDMDNGKRYPFWEATLKMEELGIHLSSYEDVKFCFSHDNSYQRDKQVMKFLYRTKEWAKLHLEMQIVLRYKPEMLTTWTSRNNKPVARVITPTYYYRSLRKKRNRPAKEHFNIDMPYIDGWICVFKSKGKIYGMEVEYMKYNGYGSHKSQTMVKDYLYHLC